MMVNHGNYWDIPSQGRKKSSTKVNLWRGQDRRRCNWRRIYQISAGAECFARLNKNNRQKRDEEMRNTDD
jgi:hypothetical protein